MPKIRAVKHRSPRSKGKPRGGLIRWSSERLQRGPDALTGVSKRVRNGNDPTRAR